MSPRELRRRLAAADPVDRTASRASTSPRWKASWRADLEGSWPVADPGQATSCGSPTPGCAATAPPPSPQPRPGRRRRGARRRRRPGDRPRRRLGGSGGPAPAYGANLVRFAESSPLLLLEGPGWRVQHVSQDKTQPKAPTARWNSSPARRSPTNRSRSSAAKSERREGNAPARDAPTTGRTPMEPRKPGGSRRKAARLPPPARPTVGQAAGPRHDRRRRHPGRVLCQSGRPGESRDDRLLVRRWLTLSLKAAVPDLAAFEERLGWLTKVGSQEWLEAMPAAVVKADDFHGTVGEMIEGNPPAEDLQHRAGPRRRADHQPRTDRQPGRRDGLLPLAAPMGRGGQQRRHRGGRGSGRGDGHLTALEDPH